MHLTRFAAVIALISLMLPSAASAAQPRTIPPSLHERGPGPQQGAATTPPDQGNAEDVRNHLDELLRQYPPSLARVLALDPTLLDNTEYLQPYPDLAKFLEAHPQIRHNPGFFLSNFETNFRGGPYRQTPQDRAFDMWRETVNDLSIGAVLVTIAGGLLWLLKSLIEHRRWSRLSKIQTDVHNKLLDRFTSNEDLLAYIQTPAGRKFLESAPIPLDSPRSIAAPVGRILWSAQVGAVLTILGLGLEVVARTAIEEVAGPLAAMGVVIIALGIGFLASAVLAYVLSRRFGLMNGDAPAHEIRG
ncbi:MAG TPA: hypothetical protein VFZ98_02795 [Vicinamibacterales bacterium]